MDSGRVTQPSPWAIPRFNMCISIRPPAVDERYIQLLVAAICNLAGNVWLQRATEPVRRALEAQRRSLLRHIASFQVVVLRSGFNVRQQVYFPPFGQFNLFPAVKISRLLPFSL